MDQIKLYKGEENGIVVEKENWDDSIFSEQYSQAISSINNMLNDSLAKITSDNDQGNDTMTPNIIAFCGDRGEGKTSCMESVVERLRLKEHPNELVYIDTIDPAYFDAKHNVVELVLGVLYMHFCSFLEKVQKNDEIKSNSKYLEDKQNLLKCFQQARGCLRNMYEGRENMFDAAEQLSIMMTGISLHTKIRDLFKAYLNFVEKYDGTNKQKKSIVLRIDDTDLNMSGAYKMLEQIRIYFNNPYCIILMSCNMDQLRKVVEDGLSKQISMSDKFNLERMALQYIIKVIPISRQIQMPKVYDLANKQLYLYSDRKDKDPQQFRSIKNAVVKLIFLNTRYLFYNSKGSVSPIIPNNLRSFRHLMGLLSDMDTFESRKDSQLNMRRFENYFYTTWTEQLKRDYKNIADELISVQDLLNLNKIAVTRLRTIVADEQVDQLKSQDVFNPNVASYNVSAGDVFTILDVIDRTSTDEQQKLLSFFIRTLYSIRLFETYDKVSDDVLQRNRKKDNDSGELYRADELFQNTNEIQRLVNGSLFTYQPNELMPFISNLKQSRDCKIVNGASINKLVTEVKAGIRKYDKMKDEETREAFQNNFRMLEFFALTIRRSLLASQEANYTAKDRGVELPSHLAPFTQNYNLYLFDILMPFVSVLNIETTYDRFTQMEEGTFYKFAIDHDWSLLRGMMKEVYNKEIVENVWDGKEIEECKPDYEYPRKRLLSNMTIRNGEVLSAVYEGVKSRRYKTYKSSDNTKMIAEFYEDIINTKMHTYPREDNKDVYTIQFSALKALASFLYKCDVSVFNVYFLLKDKKETSRQQAASKKDKEQMLIDTQWARDRYSKIKVEDDETLTGRDVTALMEEHYWDDYDILRGTEWNYAFREKTGYRGDTIFRKLGSMRNIIEYVENQD